MRQALKFLHTVTTVAFMGALLLQLAVSWRFGASLAAGDPSALAARELVFAVAEWLLLPSLLAVVVTGLLLMVVRRAFGQAGWVWAKAVLGLMLFKTVLAIVFPPARDLVGLVHAGVPASDPATLAELAQLTRAEWNGAWMAIAISLGAIALGIWRPRFSSTR
jgi:hypothetical protein